MRRTRSTLMMCLILLLLTSCGADTNEEQANGVVEGYAWGKLPKIGQEDANYCNLPENINGLDNTLPICYDTVYDIFYYVNCGADYFLYACKDGKVEKIADIPAKRLFCRDGKLYFMVESYDVCSLNGFMEGNILEYDPVTGQVSRIIEEQATSMIVYQDGIYYSKDAMQEFEKGSFIVDRILGYYSFADGNIMEFQELSGVERTLYRCGQDFLFYVVEPYQGTDEELLELADGGEITVTTGMKLADLNMTEETFLDNLLVYNDFFATETEIYYVNNSETYSEFVVYNTEQKKETKYPLSTLVQGAYIVFDDNVYFSSLQSVNLKSGKETMLSTDEMYNILEWYTDGVNLYALCSSLEDGDTVVQLKRIEIQEEKIHFISLL